MPVDKFKFVSPGVQVAEIDNSQRPAEPTPMGPVIVGRAQRGPSLRPVQVNSFSDFVEVFGMPWAKGSGNDVWRNGNYLAPSYGAYAAQAYLKNHSPVTYVRLLGRKHSDAAADTVGTSAGWKVGASPTNYTDGGTFGLFICDSGSEPADGTLAATFYVKEGAIELTGAIGDSCDRPAGCAYRSGTVGIFASVGSSYEFKALIKGGGGNLKDTINFNFNRSSKKYIRNVFNTNPTLLNSSVSTTTGTYFLGESYERAVNDMSGAGASGGAYAIILALSDGTNSMNDRLRDATGAETGWFFGQDLGQSEDFNITNQQKLFKLKSINAGAWESQNLKVSIANVRGPTNEFESYGSFTIEIRKAEDSDVAPQIVERFSDCNLNPNSVNYVARKVGDKYVTWDDDERRYREYGTYNNQSKFFYISMNTEVDNGSTNEALVPFGFIGPGIFKNFQVKAVSYNGSAGSVPTLDTTAHGGGSFTTVSIVAPVDNGFVGAIGGFTGTFNFPEVRNRTNTLGEELSSPKDAYFGLDTTRTGGSSAFDEEYLDLVRAFPRGFSAAPGSGSLTTSSFYFSLDDVGWYSGSAGYTTNRNATWSKGSRMSGLSISATGTNSWQNTLDAGFDSFTAPLVGGFDGIDIREMDPFRNSGMSGKTPLTSYAYNSIKMGIDTCADPEVVECDVMAVPGITNTGLTQHLINVCENRADALAVIDLEGGYVPVSENTSGDASSANRGNVDTTVSNLKARAINSSYGCTYYPWVQMRDPESGIMFFAPPSIAALGTFASSQNKSEVWFAPAGFNRGGLTEGSAGIPVVGVKEKLTSKQRDKLYEANINPIATFPAEGIVIFGQKTLQVTPSALDRVNVRRLLLTIKKRVSNIAARLLFDQNVQVTWDRFTGQVVPYLESVKARLGLMDYRVILDETTTTPDLVDRNIMYAKIFLKPARAIEFIAIDFVITNAGASFED